MELFQHDVSGRLADSTAIGYAPRMQKRVATILCLILLGLGVSGCTKCGWLWDDLGRACKAEMPK